jgi:hypothetical protein
MATMNDHIPTVLAIRSANPPGVVISMCTKGAQPQRSDGAIVSYAADGRIGVCILISIALRRNDIHPAVVMMRWNCRVMISQE